MKTTVQDPEAAGGGRYATVAILLHWTIALAIVLQVVLAGRMEGPPSPMSFAITQLHKSVGITILLLSLARLGWRLANPPPPLPAAMAPWEAALSKAVHWGFYVIMIAMPLTGWLMVSASRIAVPTLLYGVIPWPHVPGVAELAPGAKHVWFKAAQNSHHLLAKGLYVLLALHVAGALKHQLFRRDEPVLSRMAPGAVAGRWLEPRILVILAAFVGVIGLGRLVTPPPPGMAPQARAATAPITPAPEPAGALVPGVIAASDAPVPPKPSAAAPAAEPARWVVEPGSTLGFTSAWSSQPVQGRFDRWQADIRFSPEALDRSKVVVAIDVGSVNTGDKQRDGVLPSADWFDAAGHPKAVFTATRFEKLGPDRYLARGTLQLKGVTKPQALPFRLTIRGDEAEVSSTASLDRTAFGVGQGEFAGTDQIPGKVTVNVALKARRGG